MNQKTALEEQKIELTLVAIEKAVELKLKQGPDNAKNSLRLYLEGKGCDGFYYGVAFDEALENDVTFVFSSSAGIELAVLVDRETLTFVAGCKIDWVDDERGAGFLVENPQHKNFRGKFFKREKWRKHFEGGHQV